MPRKKPISNKQRREQLQHKRAVKRGDLPAGTPSSAKLKARLRRGPSDPASASVQSVRKLQSSFVKLPAAFLEETKLLASTLVLPRPIPYTATVFPEHWLDQSQAGDVDAGNPRTDLLSCPKRPKWRYEMTKEEVEKNEEGLFKKWLLQTDDSLREWCSSGLPKEFTTGEWSQHPRTAEEILKTTKMPHAPTSFERNLEVWRQLWRVAEISQIILILLDSRCPSLHFPPSLSSFLSSSHTASRQRIILVLTKIDISGPARANAWEKYLQSRYENITIVQVESYTTDPESDQNSGRRTHKPHIGSALRRKLVDALKITHADLLVPPERVRDDPEKMAKWRPPVRRNVDWDNVLNAEGTRVGNAPGGEPFQYNDSADHGEDQDANSDGKEPDFLTIGLIGQPNVGKSSLLNALFGTQKVKASKTPGKTKHFQTLFWTPEIRLVDCPGLVMPSFVPMEMQVLSGILPISRVSAIPLCIHFAAELLPLERIYSLEHPSESTPVPEDKRTWRDGPRNTSDKQKAVTSWTAMDILTAYALKRGWATAQAGRPDVSRAGNAILRALAESKIRWAFWPPGTDEKTIAAHQEPGAGIWQSGDLEGLTESEDNHSEGGADEDDGGEEDDDSEEADTDQDSDLDEHQVKVAGSRFKALFLTEEGSADISENEDMSDN